MRICHVVRTVAHGQLSFDDLAAGGRGVTGSEQSMLLLALEQAKAGHQVSVYMPTDTAGFHRGVEVLDVNRSWPRLRRLDTADVVISWISSDALRGAPERALKIFSIQINDFMMNGPGFDRFVDVYVCASKAHQQWLWAAPGAPETTDKVEIIPNGIDMARFKPGGERKPRRCVYLSSPDRGLHWIIAMWPEIRFAYPDAELHIFYEVQKWLAAASLVGNEVGIRAQYVVHRLNALGSHGAGIRGALSPVQLAGELQQCDLMLYPCDPVRPTEGFGVAVLDALAAGVLPILTDADALGEVYGDSGAVIVPRGTDQTWTDRYLEVVLERLQQPITQGARDGLRIWATQYDWPKVANKWDTMIQRRQRGGAV